MQKNNYKRKIELSTGVFQTVLLLPLKILRLVVVAYMCSIEETYNRCDHMVRLETTTVNSVLL
jgi:hypothetical protein